MVTPAIFSQEKQSIEQAISSRYLNKAEIYLLTVGVSANPTGVLSFSAPLLLEDENIFQKSASVVPFLFWYHGGEFLSCIFKKKVFFPRRDSQSDR
jgi:hypothetical protein